MAIEKEIGPTGADAALDATGCNGDGESPQLQFCVFNSVRAAFELKLAPSEIQFAAEVCKAYGLHVSIQPIGAVPRANLEQELRDAIDLLEKNDYRVIHKRAC